MNLTNDGLSLWYGTPDAPAPGDDGLAPRRGAGLIVGVNPPSPTNTVVVRYRVDNGLVRSVTGREIRTDYQRQAQYFAVAFPPFPSGQMVEYSPQLSCGGRQVPPPHIAQRWPSKFHLEGEQPQAAHAARVPAAGAAASRLERFDLQLQFVATVAVHFGTPQYVGDTAAGMRVNFLVRDGTVTGEGLSGKVLEGSADDMIIRRDGMGVVRIRAVFQMQDGALLDVESGGYVDFGADGHRRAVAHHLPDRSPLVVSPLITTRHPKYRWLSRLQCVGVGETHLDADQACYEIYAARPGPVT
jgi:hypothetical protein